MVLDELLAAWRVHNRINLFLLDHISEEGLLSTLSSRGGRNVARQFAHLHNVRIYQLENRGAKDLAAELVKFPGKESPPAAELQAALIASAGAVEQFFTDLVEGSPKRRGFRRGIFTTLSYFVSHESHHRGSILLTLKQSGHRLDNATSYAIWGMWDKK